MIYHLRLYYMKCLSLYYMKGVLKGTVDKTHLLLMSENDAELIINVLPWAPVELANQY